MGINTNTNIVPVTHENMYDRIMSSCVLWYDVGVQGCTNASMANRPVLYDLTGNGHDATCHNFSWDGVSGIGGYDIPVKRTALDTNIINQTSKDYIDADIYMNGNSIFKGVTLNSVIQEFNASSRIIWDDGTNNTGSDININVDVKITGLDNNKSKGITGIQLFEVLTAESDGIYHVTTTFPASTDDEASCMIYFELLSTGDIPVGDLNIKIEILPKYPNAIVSDGVDDYIYVDNLPLLNKEDGYTVIARRTILSNNVGDRVAFSKRNADRWGAFLIDKNVNRQFSFGQATVVEFNRNVDEIIYQTSTSYCGTAIDTGNSGDNNFLIIGAGLDLDGVMQEFMSMALHSFILFNRDLTDEEIEWVKCHMISGVHKYDMNFTDYIITSHADHNIDIDVNKLTFYYSNSAGIRYDNLAKNTPSFRILLRGFNANREIINSVRYYFRDQNGIESSIYLESDGVYTLPIGYQTTEGSGYSTGLSVVATDAQILELTTPIEIIQLPSKYEWMPFNFLDTYNTGQETIITNKQSYFSKTIQMTESHTGSWLINIDRSDYNNQKFILNYKPEGTYGRAYIITTQGATQTQMYYLQPGDNVVERFDIDNIATCDKLYLQIINYEYNKPFTFTIKPYIETYKTN